MIVRDSVREHLEFTETSGGQTPSVTALPGTTHFQRGGKKESMDVALRKVKHKKQKDKIQ